jgi:hypothetical protein
MKGQKLLFQFISGVLTIFVLYSLVSFVFLKSFATSLEPGWHTPIYSPKAVLSQELLTSQLSS